MTGVPFLLAVRHPIDTSSVKLLKVFIGATLAIDAERADLVRA
jgi:hypothetical protein